MREAIALIERRLAEMQSFQPELNYCRGLWQLTLKQPVIGAWSTEWRGTLGEVLAKAEQFTDGARGHITGSRGDA